MKNRLLVLILLTTLLTATEWCLAQGKWNYDFIVPDNGTFRQAINAANTRKDKARRYRIFVKSGHYRMHTNPDDTITAVVNGKKVRFANPVITLTAPNTSIVGEGAGHTQIENCPHYEGLDITPVLVLKGADSTYIQDVEIWSNFRNDPRLYANSSVAINEKGCKGNVMKKVSLLGTQNTYHTTGGSLTYMEDCAIAGTVDFICGSGTTFFNRCELRLVPRGDSSKSDIIAAPATNIVREYGFVFNDCQVWGADFKDGKYLLARPESDGAKTVYINTLMTILPSPDGWGEKNGNTPMLLAEYSSMDKWFGLVDLKSRRTTFRDKNGTSAQAPYRHELTDADTERYTVKSVFDGWNPREDARQVDAPELTLTGRTLTWNDQPEAGCYAIYRDRKLIKLTTEPHYTIPKGTYEGACYSIRCANQRGGLGEPSAEIVYSRYK